MLFCFVLNYFWKRRGEINQQKWTKRDKVYFPTWNNSNRKADKIHRMMVCKILNIRKQRTIIPETRETKYLRSTIASGSCLERISRKWHREKEPWQNPSNFLSSRDDAENLRKARQLLFSRQSNWGETYIENSRDLWQISSEHSAEYCSVHMCEETTQD